MHCSILPLPHVQTFSTETTVRKEHSINYAVKEKHHNSTETDMHVSRLTKHFYLAQTDPGDC